MNKILLILLLLGFSSAYAQEGIIKTYSNDKILESEISYINDLYDGPSYWYFPNGNIKKEINYSEGKVNGWVREYYENGLLKKEYFANNGVIEGDVKLFYDNGGLKEVLSYENGKLINSEKVNYDKNYIAPPELYALGNRQYELQKKKDNILCDIEICPAPVGGMEAIEKNIKYPEHAKLYGLEGIVILLVDVSENGTVTKTEVIKSIGLGCDEAAQEAVNNTKFMPGQNNGKFVGAQISLSVPFILDEKSEFALNYRRHKPAKPEKTYITESVKNYTAKNKSEKNKPGNNEKVNNEKEKDLPIPAQKTDVKIKNSGSNLLEYKIISGSFVNMECDADVCPVPKGGFEQILKNLVTPLSAFRKNIKGDVILIAAVDEFGYVRDTKVIQGLGYGCDEAVEVAVLGTRFEPAVKNGKKTGADIIISVPIRK
ncbi:MAG: TonB family protein [Bacteroidetes bacterium]|nr:TonB family protein [Bacteroidota bacterium]